MRLLFTILLTTFLIFFASAQSTIEGKIIDNENIPLEFANVLVLNPADSSLVKGNLSDEKGIYKFDNIETGNYLLSVTMIGYATSYKSISVGSTIQKTINDIVLVESATQLDEVAVVAKKPLFEQKIDRMVVNVQNSVTSTGSNALAILARSPGVRVDQVNNLISMNGGQSAIIMINDKRTRMDAGALIQLLESMPADNIEKIELITTPPASYDAEGDAGIINIVMLKNEVEGTNGSFTLSGGYGERPKFGGSYNLNWKKGKFNFFTDGSANSSYTQEDVTIRQTINTNEGGELYTDVFSNRPAFKGLYNARIGLDYELNERTTIGVLYSRFRRQWELDAQTTTAITDQSNEVTTSNLRSEEINKWSNWMGNINFRHTFINKSKLTVDYDYLDFNSDNPTDYLDKIYDASNNLVEENTFISRKESPLYFHVAKVDYARPISEKGNIEFGVKGTLSEFKNDVGVADIDNGEEIYNSDFTSILNMDEYIYAVYTAADWTFSEKTAAKIGFRYEYTNTDLSNNTGETLVKREFGRVFPSFFLSHQLTEYNSLQFSYSERIQRPSFNVLAPAFFFFSPNNIVAGNPTIKYTITRQIQASYRYKTVGFSIRFSDDENPFVFGQPEASPDQNITITRPQNMEDKKNISASLNFPLKITTWWETRFDATAIWEQSKPIYEGQIVTQTNIFGTGSITQTFTIPKKFTLELSGQVLNTPLKYGLNEIPLRAGFNLGLQKTFKNNSKLSLNWQDIFNSYSHFKLDAQHPDLNLAIYQKFDQEGSIFTLTYAHSFGNNKIKKAGQRKAASEEERQRTN